MKQSYKKWPITLNPLDREFVTLSPLLSASGTDRFSEIGGMPLVTFVLTLTAIKPDQRPFAVKTEHLMMPSQNQERHSWTANVSEKATGL